MHRNQRQGAGIVIGVVINGGRPRREGQHNAAIRTNGFSARNGDGDCGALALMVLALPSAAVPAAAGSSGASVDHAVMAGLTDVSAAKRKRRAVRRHRGPSAAGMAFMGMAMGMMGAAIAESQRRDYYDRYYGPRYSYGPRDYRQPYGYYGGGFYGRRHYYGY